MIECIIGSYTDFRCALVAAVKLDYARQKTDLDMDLNPFDTRTNIFNFRIQLSQNLIITLSVNITCLT